MIRKIIIIIFILLMMLFLFSGCFSLKVENNLDYPATMFARTIKEINAKKTMPSEIDKDFRSLNFLIYDGSERKLISFSIAKEFLEFGLNKGLEMSDNDLLDRSDRYIKVNLDKIRNLRDLGPGLLIRVEDYKANTHVLIWLD